MKIPFFKSRAARAEDKDAQEIIYWPGRSNLPSYVPRIESPPQPRSRRPAEPRQVRPPRPLPPTPQQPSRGHVRPLPQPPRQTQQASSTYGEFENLSNYQGRSNLKRHNAQHGKSSRWVHMKRCELCEHDNMCREEPGQYQCENFDVILRKRCFGKFTVTPRDAAQFRRMPLEHRVPFESLADRYDYEGFMRSVAENARASRRAAA